MRLHYRKAMHSQPSSEASGSVEASAAAFSVREPPLFGDPADERRHRLERLAAACRLFGRLGFSEGLLGHLTVRDPEQHDRLWLNPIGVSFRQMKVSDLVQVNSLGELTHGNRAVNPVGLRLHTAVHAARPDVNAMCHAHSPHGRAWSTLGRLLDPISQDSCVFFEQQALIVDPRIALNEELANQFADAFGFKRVGIQEGHGIFTTGQSIDEAAWWFVSMESCCHTQLLAEAAGTPKMWPPDEARMLARGLGSSTFGWQSFQPFWDELIESDPNMLQ